MKQLFISVIFLFSLSSFAQVFEHKELADILGYSQDVKKNKFLTASERICIEKYASYKTPYYEDINPYLRGQMVEYEYVRDEEELKFYVEKIDSGLLKLPTLPRDLVLFRGEGLKHRGNKPHKEGDIVTQLAYTSTSTNEGEAKQFLSSNSILFIMYSTQKKFRGIVMNDIENEVLLPRGMVFKVMKVRPIKNIQGRESAFVGIAQICEAEHLCESKISNSYVKDIWESDVRLPF